MNLDLFKAFIIIIRRR